MPAYFQWTLKSGGVIEEAARYWCSSMLFSWVIGKIFIFGSLFVILFQLSVMLQFTIVQSALGANYALVLLNFRV